jgi:hypothetical protein
MQSFTLEAVTIRSSSISAGMFNKLLTKRGAVAAIKNKRKEDNE